MSRLEFQNATSTLVLIASLTLLGTAARADTSSVELAKKLSNPVASLISVPFQFNTMRTSVLLKTGTRQS